MLHLDQIELADLCLALEDQSEERAWWLNLDTGEIDPSPRNDPVDLPGNGPRRQIEPLPATVAYGDMEDFVQRLRDSRARDVLARSIVGRGAFRRFKDELLKLPELRQAWFEFHDTRTERRALEWLVDQEIGDRVDVQEAIAALPDPDFERSAALLDGFAVARRAARDIRRAYKERLRGVFLIGEWAHGDASPESPVELVVVLDDVADRWEEQRYMDRILWRHSARNDTVVTELPVSESEFGRAATPFLSRAAREGVRVA